ncbi:MAG: hypothetical protein ABFD52_02920 [Acidobacteriota bacterium]
MKAVKTLGLTLAFVLAFAPIRTFPGLPQTGAVTNGFLGVPWGANQGEVTKAMKARGYRKLQGAETGSLVFKGAFAGYPCQLTFRLLANSFYGASASFIARSGRPAAPQQAFLSIIQDLTDKYGPPKSRKSGKIQTNDGKEHPRERAEWELVDGATSDRYAVSVDLEVTWFADDSGDQYVVDVSYQAVDLGERLKKQEY